MDADATSCGLSLSLNAGTYYFRVCAYNNAGNSGYTNESYVTISQPVPNAPSNLYASAAGSTQINLTWTDTADNETGFKLERKTGLTGAYAQIADLGVDVSSYNDTSVSAGNTYYYKARAYNTAGDSSYSNEASGTTPPAGTIPAAPTNLTVNSVASSVVQLTWTDNSYNESGFKIEFSTNGINFGEVATRGANVTTYTVGSLVIGATYHFRVRAYNDSGNSNYTNVVAIVVS